MDYYSLLKLGHILGFILLGGGLLAVFMSELQAYRTSSLQVFAEASRYTAVFYDSFVISGAILVGVSGFFLILDLGLGFFEEPWIVGMWGLFLFEFIEGNTITRIQFRKTLRHSQAALEAGSDLTDDLRDEARGLINQITHFLDIPLFIVIVYCGSIRPDSWLDVGIAILIAVAVACLMTFFIPRLARRSSP
jgi:uncharacterized membrane protein